MVVASSAVPVSNTRVSIIGIGNELRGDDAAGLLAARLLKSYLTTHPINDLAGSVEVIESDGEMSSLFEAWSRADHAIIVDSCISVGRRGVIRKIDLLATDPQFTFELSAATSSHHFDLAHAVQMAKLLNRLPARLTAYLIEGGRYDLGSAVSSAVDAAVREVVPLVLAELATAYVR